MNHSQPRPQNRFLPVCRRDLEQREWAEIDILFVTGDAYIDHPAFGTALLARMLESQGFKVGIIAQPDWKNPDSLKTMGRPRLFAAVSSGAMDSMVNHYTAAKKIRSNDAYTPGGKAGKRPNRAVIAYTAAVKSAFKGLPVIIGGIEASLRRLAHYDYWDDKVRRSILVDSKADLLLYGMAEAALTLVARRLNDGQQLSELGDIRGTARLCSAPPRDAVTLPSFEEVSTSADSYNEAFRLAGFETNPYCARPLSQAHGNRCLIVNPPTLPVTEEELDRLYALPFTRKPHDSYRDRIPAYEQIRHSITSHRGCFGGCAFCAITHHQGKLIQSRSQESIMNEVDRLTRQDDFYGTISDVGGPTANMYGLDCGHAEALKSCRRPSCLYPNICKNLITDDGRASTLLKQIRRHDKVRHTFIGSGIRYDLLALQPAYFDALIRHHISGLLKVAPESTSDRVTTLMRKPGARVFTEFLDQFRKRNRQAGLRQSVVPYLISGHPGCTLADMVDVALYLKRHQLKVEQVQDFTPTPGSLSTCIYHTGKDPYTDQAIYVPKSVKEKRLQKALLLYHSPAARKDIREALKLSGRGDAEEELLGSEKRPQQNDRRQTHSSKPKRNARRPGRKN